MRDMDIMAEIMNYQAMYNPYICRNITDTAQRWLREIEEDVEYLIHSKPFIPRPKAFKLHEYVKTVN